MRSDFRFATRFAGRDNAATEPSQPIPDVLFVLPIVLLAIGAVLTWLGWRGRQTDNHPICRKCGFDLFGLGESVRCPECGTELSARLIRLGHRALRRWPFAIGLLLVIPSVVLLLAVMIASAKKIDLQTYKPVGWLLRERDALALAELNRRLAAGGLSTADIDRVVTAALSAQADMNRPFLVGWGDFVERARGNRKVSDDSWRKYARQAVPLELVARQAVRRGDPFPMEVLYGPVRLGTVSVFRVELNLVLVTLGDTPLERTTHWSTTHNNWGTQFNDRGTYATRALRATPAELASLADGPIKMRARIVIKMIEPADSVTTVGPEVSRQTLDLTTTVRLQPQNWPVVELVNDALLKAAVERSLALPRYRTNSVDSYVTPPSRGRYVRINNEYAEFSIDATEPPIALAFDVSVRDPSGREWPMNSISFPQGVRRGWLLNAAWAGFDADRVDVILRPSPAAAASTVDILRIWNESIVFKNVPVLWYKATVRPTTRPTSPRIHFSTTTRSSR